MTENEKLRALLAEARDGLVVLLPKYPQTVVTELIARIDAALAEPVVPVSPMADVAARMGAHAIGHREGWEAGFAAGKKDAERERDEARAYADKLAAAFAEGALPKDLEVLRNANATMARELHEARAEVAVFEKQNIEMNDASVALEKQLAEARAEVERLREAGAWMDEVVRKAACAVAYRRGAEAMREAAARECESAPSTAHRDDLSDAIRALPIPEDKP